MLTVPNAEERLVKEAAEGYTNLSKWLIALSTGAIMLSLNLVKPHTAEEWKSVLLFGIGLLVISILSGVRYVRLRVDGLVYNYNQIKSEKGLDHYSQYDPNATMMFDGDNREVGDIMHDLREKLKKAEANMHRVNIELKPLFHWQQYLFYSGIVMLTIFGIFGL